MFESECRKDPPQIWKVYFQSFIVNTTSATSIDFRPKTIIVTCTVFRANGAPCWKWLDITQ